MTCTSAGKSGIGITSMDGANISDLIFRDISLSGTTEPIQMYVGARAWQRRPPPYNVGSISRIRFQNIAATNVTGKPPSYSRPTNFTTTIDGQGVSQNSSTVHFVSDVHFSNLSIHYKGGGTAADAVTDAVPWHNPNDGGPRTSGVHGVRPSYGLFLRLLRDSTFDGVTLDFAHNDDRPAVVLIDCRNVSFTGEPRMARGSGSRYDVGMRDSTAIEIAGGILACDYPHCPEPTAAPAEPPRAG